jgi:DNA polymerase-3 subunit gamma/tau
MFENIIGQADTIASLKTELAAGAFPRAALFVGPAWSGKLSTALETARVLTCLEDPRAEWSCACRSCALHKELSHPHTVLLGPRYADVELAACAEALMRSRKTATLYLYLRAVRKLTRRFEPSILDTDDPKQKGSPDKAARVEELLAGIPVSQELPPERELGEILEKITAAAAPLAAQVRSDTITIGQVRRLAAWAHVTAGSRKVAVVENADRMQDSARNALLKLLEQPPEGVHLLLLSTRRAAIIPTVLSRLRPYPFEARSPEVEAEVMRKIFRDDPPRYPGLRSLFLAWRAINPERLAALAARFVDLAKEAGDGSADILREMAEVIPDRRGPRDRSAREAAASFLEELAALLRARVRAGDTALEVLESWGQALRDASARLEALNMTPSTVLEALFLSMRAAALSPGSLGAGTG